MSEPIYWDTYDRDIWKDPYPTYRRMREEQPLYYNEKHDFYALSRFADVHAGLRDTATYSSARGGILEMIRADVEFPQSMFIFQDPPVHTAFRSIMQKIITPRRMNALEEKIRELCARSLDPFVDEDGFDFITNLGAEMPMRAIGMLLGIPEEDQEKVREMANDNLRADAETGMMAYDQSLVSGDMFADYITWREKNPSDDIMTELLNVEFKDPQGEVRKLKRDELLSIVQMVAGAGNETTTRLIGWAGKLLAEHPDQRRDLVNDFSLIPRAIEELIRYESPGQAPARTLTRDVEIHGQTVPAGSVVMLIAGSANRDDRHFENGDSFNIHREIKPHVGFGHGPHVCIGAPLARLEGRVALEEVLKRFPEWEVDLTNAELSPTTTVRGWDNMPAYKPGKKPAPGSIKHAEPVVESGPVDVASLAGKWNVTIKSPTGPQPTVLDLRVENGQLSGEQTGQGQTTSISDAKLDGNQITWINHVKKPIKIKVTFTGTVQGNSMTGKAKAGFMGSFPFTAERS